MLRNPHCLDNLLIDGGKVVSSMHRPLSTPQKHYFSASGIHFCQRLSKLQGLVWQEGLGTLKNSFTSSGPEPSGLQHSTSTTMLPRAPYTYIYTLLHTYTYIHTYIHTSPPSVSQLSRKCTILNVSKLYRPSQSVTGIDFFFFFFTFYKTSISLL
jgi:hypothetical protein